MKNLQKGSIVSLLMAIIAVLVIGGGVYIYNNKKSESPSVLDTKTQNSDQTEQQVNTQTPSTPNQFPIITKVNGPESLNVNQLGTWTITASNATLYYVVWGDEAQYPAAGHNLGQQQSATFTHSYSATGVYTPKFYAQNANGDVQKSVRVEVLNSTSPGLNTTYTYTNHGFSIKLPGGFIPKEWQSEGGPALMISLPVGGLAYVSDASFWERYNIPNYTYVTDKKIGDTTFKVYTAQGSNLYWFKQGNVGYEFSVQKFGTTTDTTELENLLKTFKFIGWSQN